MFGGDVRQQITGEKHKTIGGRGPSEPIFPKLSRPATFAQFMRIRGTQKITFRR